MLDGMDIYNLALRPNCLLTKYPFIFLNGPRSLFFHEKLGGTLQDYMTAHGYKIHCPPLPFRGQKNRVAALKAWLKQNEIAKAHIVCGRKTALELAEAFDPVRHSITFADDFSGSEETHPDTRYKLHSRFTRLMGAEPEEYSAVFPVKNVLIYDRFLDRCIELAENE